VLGASLPLRADLTAGRYTLEMTVVDTLARDRAAATARAELDVAP
jgi:hypothetical protein